jgi:hypothetical protein
MSVLGFDIRDYTDPNRILEQSLAPQSAAPQPPQSSGNGYAPPAPQQAPPVPQRAPVTVDNSTGQQVTAPAGINPAATQQPPAVPIPGTAAPSIMGYQGAKIPAVIKPMEGVTNEDRVHAMAMVLGAVGQNNFSNVLNTAQTGLMQKEINAKKHNDDLAKLTVPDYSIQSGKVNYVPARYEIDSDGNYVLRSEEVRAKEAKEWAAANPSLDHPGGATGQREDAYIERYRRLPTKMQLEQAEAQGVYGRPLNEFELIDRHMKNSIGLASGMATATESGTAQSRRLNDNFLNWYDIKENAETSLDKLDETIRDLRENDGRGGFFQPIEQYANAILAEFDNEEAVRDATREQILESESIQRMMEWFKRQGLGARGLDTPAEFQAWLKATGGNLSMTNDATIHFLERAREDILKGVDKYNEAFEKPNYQANVVGMENYSPLLGLRDRYKDDDKEPELPPGFIVLGQQQ